MSPASCFSDCFTCIHVFRIQNKFLVSDVVVEWLLGYNSGSSTWLDKMIGHEKYHFLIIAKILFSKEEEEFLKIIFFFFWISNSAAFTFWSSSLLIYSFTSADSIAILSCFNQFIRVTDSCRDEWNIQNGSSNVWAWKILLSYNIKYFVLKRRWRIFEEFLFFIFSESDIQNQFITVTDSCRDEWNIWNGSSSKVLICGDRWNVQNWWCMKCTNLVKLLQSLNMNTPELNLHYLSFKSIIFELVMKPMLMLLLSLFGSCFYVWLFGMYHS